jgi:hypothetical protein
MGLQRLPTPVAPVPSPRPNDFGDGYRPPAHKTYPLAKYNFRPEDGNIEFFEEPHVYMVCGKPAMCSMTQLAHSRQEHFDAPKVIHGMKSGRTSLWPRLKYVHNAVRVDLTEDGGGGEVLTADASFLFVSGEQTVAVFPSRSFGDDLRGEALRKALLAAVGRGGGVGDGRTGGTPPFHPKRPAPGAEPASSAALSFDALWAYTREMTEEEIVDAWRANGQDASNRGTEAHYQLQLATEGQPFRDTDEEVRIGLQFFARVRNEWRAFRTEWEVYYEPAGLAGSIDLVIARGGGEYDDDEGPLELAIVDYKRSNKLERSMVGPRRMSAEFSHLDDCDGAAYALQLSGYQRMLEEMGYTVVDRMLVSVHPEAPYTTSVPYLVDEVEYLFACERAATAATETLEASRCCAESGVALTDAVRVSERQGLVHRKCAQAFGWDVLESDDEVGARVTAHRQAARDGVVPPEFPKNWKRALRTHNALVSPIVQTA